MQTENYLKTYVPTPVQIKETTEPTETPTPLKKGFHTWNHTAAYWPEEGRAIVWLSMQGSNIDGVVVYKLRPNTYGKIERVPVWLPLRTDYYHQADVPIKYNPGLWRYVEPVTETKEYTLPKMITRNG
jgi:hypothetical protein